MPWEADFFPLFMQSAFPASLLWAPSCKPTVGPRRSPVSGRPGPCLQEGGAVTDQTRHLGVARGAAQLPLNRCSGARVGRGRSEGSESISLELLCPVKLTPNSTSHEMGRDVTHDLGLTLQPWLQY